MFVDMCLNVKHFTEELKTFQYSLAMCVFIQREINFSVKTSTMVHCLTVFGLQVKSRSPTLSHYLIICKAHFFLHSKKILGFIYSCCSSILWSTFYKILSVELKQSSLEVDPLEWVLHTACSRYVSLCPGCGLPFMVEWAFAFAHFLFHLYLSESSPHCSIRAETDVFQTFLKECFIISSEYDGWKHQCFKV